jgi:hypothetical protein
MFRRRGRPAVKEPFWTRSGCCDRFVFGAGVEWIVSTPHDGDCSAGGAAAVFSQGDSDAPFVLWYSKMHFLGWSEMWCRPEPDAETAIAAARDWVKAVGETEHDHYEFDDARARVVNRYHDFEIAAGVDHPRYQPAATLREYGEVVTTLVELRQASTYE